MSEHDDNNSRLSALQNLTGRDSIASVESLLGLVTAGIYTELKTAIELGKWPDGNKLAERQLEYCMQLLILYENKTMPEDRRTGLNVPTGCGKDSKVKSA